MLAVAHTKPFWELFVQIILPIVSGVGGLLRLVVGIVLKKLDEQDKAKLEFEKTILGKQTEISERVSRLEGQVARNGKTH